MDKPTWALAGEKVVERDHSLPRGIGACRRGVHWRRVDGAGSTIEHPGIAPAQSSEDVHRTGSVLRCGVGAGTDGGEVTCMACGRKGPARLLADFRHGEGPLRGGVRQRDTEVRGEPGDLGVMVTEADGEVPRLASQGVTFVSGGCGGGTY